MRQRNKKFSISLVLCVSILFIFNAGSHAVPAAPHTQELKQPDGSKFKVKIRGDERLHWHETEDGYTIIKDKSTNWWHYAMKDKNRGLIISGHKVGEAGVERLDLKRGLLPLRKQYRAMPAQDAAFKSTARRDSISFPHTQNLIVIMVDFNNVVFTYTPESFQSLFFSSSTKSVADYYDEVSYGKFQVVPATDTYGMTAGIIGWLRLNQNHPDCESLIDSTTCYEALVSNSIKAADPYINFSSFDSNGDNSITPDELSIIIIAAGYEEAYGTASGPGVWAHNWRLSVPLTLDGKSVKDYAMFGEKQDSHQATIGVMVHELGHLMLDLPDLYDIEGNSSGIGYFDLMSKGAWCKSASDNYSGQTPVHLSAWSKEYAGFVTPTVTTDQKGVSFPSVSASSAVIVKAPTQNANEYFLIENRYMSGYDSGLQGCLNGSPTEGGGLAIWHIDKSLLNDGCITWNNCNANKKHRLVDLEEADGTQDLDGTGSSKLQDLFHAGNNSSFNEATTPNNRAYSGISNNVAVTNISTYGGTMSADIKAFSSTPITPANQLLNAGFESGKVNWSEFSSGGYNVISQDSQGAFGGSWYAGLGWFNNAIEYVYQDITISSNATQAYLQFWYYISTEGATTNTTATDIVIVEIRDPGDNTLLKTLETLSNLDYSSAWVVSEQFNISEFAGRTVRLRFYATNSSSTKTLFLIDNASLMALSGTGNGMRSPANVENYAYAAVATPALSSDPASAKPFATGDINSGALSLSVGFTGFNSAVDIYLGIYAPAYSSEIYIIKSDNSLQLVSSGLAKWRENTLGPIDVSLYGNIPMGSLLPGTYYLYTVVAPAGSISSYYLWTTSFTVP